MEHQNNVQNLLKIKSKDTRTIVNFEQFSHIERNVRNVLVLPSMTFLKKQLGSVVKIVQTLCIAFVSTRVYGFGNQTHITVKCQLILKTQKYVNSKIKLFQVFFFSSFFIFSIRMPLLRYQILLVSHDMQFMLCLILFRAISMVTSSNSFSN